jgi:magnesium-transporting ATPase (P-type)
MHCCFAKLGVHVFRGEAFEQKAAQALRVLGAYCERRGACYDAAEATGDIDRLTWTGLVGLADPVRQGLPALMHKLHCAGIQTIMLTGDQSATARAVAERIGLSPGVPVDRNFFLDAVSISEDKRFNYYRPPPLRLFPAAGLYGATGAPTLETELKSYFMRRRAGSSARTSCLSFLPLCAPRLFCHGCCGRCSTL